MTFEWISPVIGGVLISLSLGAFIVLNGTTCSLGDMLKNTLERKPSVSWNNQILFLIGILISPLVFTILFYPITGASLDNEPLTVIISGLLVGAGFELSKGGIITNATLGFMGNPKISIILIMLFLLFARLTQVAINL
jgi:hypothetical protein